MVKLGVNKTSERVLIAAALAALVVLIYLFHIGWNNPITDLHGFRQTQTAISAYYIKNGQSPLIDYETPVMGKPWSIPFEFPTFQWLTALVSQTTSLGLDQSGRLVSVVFFLLTLVAAALLLLEITSSWNSVLLMVIVASASPVFIFWSRTFMIESTALFFGTVFAFALIKFLRLQHTRDERWKSVGLAGLCLAAGALCGLTKSTTFVVFLALVTLFGLYILVLQIRGAGKDVLRVFPKYIVAFVVVSTTIVVSWLWVAHTDQVKMQNMLARDFITSKALFSWNFGKLSQRIDLIFLGHLFEEPYRVAILISTLALAAIGRRHRSLIALLLVSYLIAPLIFTNLYLVHNYYWYANTLLLVLAMSVSASSAVFDTRGIARAAAVAIFAVAVAYSYAEYKLEYYGAQVTKRDIPSLAKTIRDHTSKDDVILIYGLDWSSEVPYYAERRALMDRWSMDPNSPNFKAVVAAVGEDSIRAIAAPKGYDEAKLAEMAFHFGFTTRIQSADGDSLFVK